MRKIIFILTLYSISFFSNAFTQNIRNNPNSNHGNKFEQLGTILPEANEYRNSAGAPTSKYWQQRADYKINCSLDEKTQTLYGEETITYYNNSPDDLTYLWLQLDENQHHPTNNSGTKESQKMSKVLSDKDLFLLNDDEIVYKSLGTNILDITDMLGKKLNYTINKTMMRIDLPTTLLSKQKISFKIKWSYRVPDRILLDGSRGGYEFFPEDKNYIFTIAQWYPRMCVYSDFGGWQHKQFTGRGEFALTFGDFDVNITVPKDYVIASTGECQNYQQVLTPQQYQRFLKAKSANTPIEIVTFDEMKESIKKTEMKQTQTWHYVAKNVRDFAWGASRRFVWDAMGVDINNNKVMAMSYYPQESYHLYKKYSTKTVAHTLKVYSHYTIDYPYPVAISVEASNGMEYPMICFNYGRTEKDGTYSENIKHGAISVIIHEVGHNFFPMMINSDERQWSWMDEGLNTFVQYLSEQEFSNNYPSRRGPAHLIVDYMKMPTKDLEPIMTNSENIIRFGDNAYGKPAAALNILRETVMGRELFDFAFKTYAKRWAFKHPTPADFFRTMEDASGVDLDWFWRAWFFDITPVDIAIDSLQQWSFDTAKLDIVKDSTKIIYKEPFNHITKIRNKQQFKDNFLVQKDTALVDFYDSFKPWLTEDSVTKIYFDRYDLQLTQSQIDSIVKGKYFYQLYFSNKGGTPSPIILQFNFEDNTQEQNVLNADIWRKDENKCSYVFIKNKPVKSIQLDPLKQTADINEKNNIWNISDTLTVKSDFKLFKQKEEHARSVKRNYKNPMQKYQNDKKQ